MPLLPPVKWAQRADRLFVTFDLQDAKDPELAVTNDEEAKAGKISFRAKAHSHATGPEEHAYAEDLVLFDEVDVEDVRQAKTARSVTVVLGKKTPGDYWPRLLKAAGKAPSNVKVDWDRWADEDDEDVDENAGFDPSALQGLGGGAGGPPGGFDMSQFAGMMGGGAGGAPGGFDMSQLAGMMGGSAGMDGLGAGGEDFSDSDDGSEGDDAADLPALVKDDGEAAAEPEPEEVPGPPVGEVPPATGEAVFEDVTDKEAA